LALSLLIIATTFMRHPWLPSGFELVRIPAMSKMK
jgi:hypothetical protein